jgi:hypothetical protein
VTVAATATGDVSIDGLDAVLDSPELPEVAMPSSADDIDARGGDSDDSADADDSSDSDAGAPDALRGERVEASFDPSDLLAMRSREAISDGVDADGAAMTQGGSAFTPAANPPIAAPASSVQLPGWLPLTTAHTPSGSAGGVELGRSIDAITARDEITRGRIHNAYATLVVGDGDQRVELGITARGEHVHITATAGNAELAAALKGGSGELASALAQHGLSLGDLQTGGGTSSERNAQGGGEPRAPGERTTATSSTPSSPSGPATPTGVRVVA